MTQDAPVILPVHCVECDGAATLQMRTWRNLRGADRTTERNQLQQWSCPYCQKLNDVELAGELAWVTKGHGAEPQVSLNDSSMLSTRTDRKTTFRRKGSEPCSVRHVARLRRDLQGGRIPKTLYSVTGIRS